MDGYVRVSVVGGRSGERFQSPDQQRESIAGWAQAHGVKIGEWHEDLDRSGGTMDRPGMNRALERVANGQSGGVIVARLDRFARTVVGGLTTIRELDEKGARVVSVAESLDPATPMGRAMLGLLLIMAEWQRDQANEHLAAAQTRAASAGRFPGRAGYGYAKTKEGLTEVDSDAAPILLRIFTERAQGVGWQSIADRLTRDHIPTPRGHKTWATSTLTGIVRSETPLGVFVGPRDLRIEGAWPALVSQELWNQANAKRGVDDRERRHDDRLLAGRARCATCRRVLRRTTNQSGDHSYSCRNAGCDQRASITAMLLDDYVAAMIDERLARIAMQPHVADDDQDLTAALARRDNAVQELEAWRDDLEMREIIREHDYREGLFARARARDDAEADVARLRAQRGLDALGELPEGMVPRLEDFAWDVRRRIVDATIHAVWLRRAEVRGPSHAMRHADRRILVSWQDDPSLPELPDRRGGEQPPVDW